MATYGRSAKDRDTQPVAITSVNTRTRRATGMTRIRTTINIDCRYPVGGAYTIPTVGEQWYVDRYNTVWRLQSRIPFNDNNLEIEPVQGQVIIGSTGPVELNGSQVNIHSNFRLGETLYRDNDGVFESRPEAGTEDEWAPVAPEPPAVVLTQSEYDALGAGRPPNQLYFIRSEE